MSSNLDGKIVLMALSFFKMIFSLLYLKHLCIVVQSLLNIDQALELACVRNGSAAPSHDIYATSHRISHKISTLWHRPIIST